MEFSRRTALSLIESALLGRSQDLAGAQNHPRSRPPNIVLLQADYMGYTDTEPYGASDIRTPNLQRLANEGVRFSDAYATASICAPSRAAFLTGRYQARFGLEQNPPSEKPGSPPTDRDVLSLWETTFADLLRQSGYATAMAGKWHLGFGPKFGPNARGFEESLAFYDWSMDYFSHRTRTGNPALYENGRAVSIEGYSTDLFTDRAISFIEKQRNKPFFVYVAYNATLPPFQPPSRPGEIYAKDSSPVPMDRWHKEGRPNLRQDYVETVEALDTAIGRILQTLDRLQISNDTIVVFTYDHGGTAPVRHAPLSHGFGSLYEGGIRVPCILRWPAYVPRKGCVRPHQPARSGAGIPHCGGTRRTAPKPTRRHGSAAALTRG
jgi:arylsulfatase A-like enzyme